ncbi:MAG: DUF5687 family protein [Bacteroidota bacterium]
MLRQFLSLQWKSATRSPMWQKNLALNIVVGFFITLFGLYLIMLGFLIGKILEELFPGRDILTLFNGALVYYFLFDLLIRFMMQALPRLQIESFIHLPFRKKSLIHFMIGRTVFDVFNLLPILVFLPCTFTLVLHHADGVTTLFWFINLVLVIFANNFLATLFKRQLGSKPLILLGVGVILATLVLLEKYSIISLSSFSIWFFGYIPSQPLFMILPLLWMIVCYFFHYQFLKKHLYPDEVQVKKNLEVQESTSSGYLRSLGLTGSIISVEMKLYWRNKRTRTIIYMLPVFLLYGLMFYPNHVYQGQFGFFMFVGAFMTGGMMMNYANYSFGYESSYFDALLTKNIDFYQYIRVKYIISVIICSVCFILTISYVFYGYKILLINFVMFLYNIGILSLVLLYFATYNKRRMDLTRGAAFNYQGVGAMNWLAVLPAFLLPVLIYIPFKAIGHPYLGIVLNGLLGLLGLLFSGTLIRLISRNFYKRKYIMAASFREK